MTFISDTVGPKISFYNHRQQVGICFLIDLESSVFGLFLEHVDRF